MLIYLQGIGETLRGTLNSSIDDRYASSNAEKAAAARAKNQAVLDRGRHEVEGIPRRQHHPTEPISRTGTGYTHQSTDSYGGAGQGLAHQSTQPMSPGGQGLSSHPTYPTSATGYSYSQHDPTFIPDNASEYRSPHEPMPGKGGIYKQTTVSENPISPIDHQGQDHHGQRRSIDSDPNSTLRGNAEPGSHSAVFGLTPDGTRHLDTTPSPPPGRHEPIGTEASSVSNLTSSTGNEYNSGRGTTGRQDMVRQDSGMAPESVSGVPERVPTMRQNEGTSHDAANRGEQFSSSHAYGGEKKQSTLGKLFKRKPVGNNEQGVPGENARKTYY